MKANLPLTSPAYLISRGARSVSYSIPVIINQSLSTSYHQSVAINYHDSPRSEITANLIRSERKPLREVTEVMIYPKHNRSQKFDCN